MSKTLGLWTGSDDRSGWLCESSGADNSNISGGRGTSLEVTIGDVVVKVSTTCVEGDWETDDPE